MITISNDTTNIVNTNRNISDSKLKFDYDIYKGYVIIVSFYICKNMKTTYFRFEKEAKIFRYVFNMVNELEVMNIIGINFKISFSTVYIQIKVC